MIIQPSSDYNIWLAKSDYTPEQIDAAKYTCRLHKVVYLDDGDYILMQYFSDREQASRFVRVLNGKIGAVDNDR